MLLSAGQGKTYNQGEIFTVAEDIDGFKMKHVPA